MDPDLSAVQMLELMDDESTPVSDWLRRATITVFTFSLCS
jgi:hypothetical protein